MFPLERSSLDETFGEGARGEEESPFSLHLPLSLFL
jgi:hypothetical protein